LDTITPNLSLTVNSNLTAAAKANLYKIDALGATISQDASSNTLIKSIEDIYFLPNSPDIGGSGTGGSLFFGSASQTLDAVTFYITDLDLYGNIGLKDQASGGTKQLRLKYKSDVSGSVDTGANRSLSIDVEGADRTATFGTNVSFSTSTLSLAGVAYTFPSAAATLVDLDDPQTLVNKVLSGSSNSFSNVPYGALVLTSSIVNADISPSAAIAYSKLNLSGALVNSDVSTSAAIAYSKLNLTGSLVNADVNTSAAIAGTKISPNFGSQNIRSTGQLQVAKSGSVASNFICNAAQTVDITYTLPATAPTTNQVLTFDGASLSWNNAGSGTVTSVAVSLSTEAASILDVSGSPVTSSGTFAFDLDTQTANTALLGPTTGAAAKPTFRALVANDIPSLTTSKISDFNSSWDSRLATKSTTDLAEGSNLYYTNARVDTRLATYKFTATWAPGDGTSKSITHSLATNDVTWNIYDISSGEEVWPDTAIRTSTNAMTFTSSVAPSGSGWKIVVRG
jgi:hypothetical protein